MVSYLLIDDDVDSKPPAEMYTRELEAASQGALTFKAIKPTDLATSLEAIAQSGVDGLLLDIAFINAASADGEPLAYNGIALAQQIRTLQTIMRTRGGGLPELPIIRFSKKDIVSDYVSKDTTSDDLFDEKIDKDQVLLDPSQAVQKLQSIAFDYPALIAFAEDTTNEVALSKLLGCDPLLFGRLDTRALLGLRRRGVPPHILSRQLIGVLLGKPGPLIDEPLLALRLGIDMNKSSDWPSVTATLSRAAYAGAFANGYPRWWTPLFLDWWSETIDQDRTPGRLPVEERVTLLKQKLGLERLTALQPIAESPGQRFWHFCVKSHRPVDPTFGFPLLPEWGQEVWQDTEYLCEEEAIQNIRNPRLSLSERQRAESARQRKG